MQQSGGLLPPTGERAERCLWQMQRGERVAAVEKIEETRKPEDFFGHRNRKTERNLYFAIGKMQTNLKASHHKTT